MKFFVRTTGDRDIHNTYAQIKYSLLVDTNYDPVNHFIKSLHIISEFDSVLLEDDLILCNNFKNEIDKAISLYPNRIINFFQNPNKYQEITEQNVICYNQCTFYPKGVAHEIANIMEKLYPDTEHVNKYSFLEAKAFEYLGISIIQYRPCLVQHLDNETLLSKMTIHNRRTPYFIDYLNELEVSYEEASDPKIREKLVNLLHRDFPGVPKLSINPLWKD